MTDADLSTPIEELDAAAWRSIDEGYDVVIASRALPGANVEVHQPWYRENSGRLFNFWCACSRCPACTTRSAASSSSARRPRRRPSRASRLDGFSFDVEALFIARRRGCRIAEVPVTWRNDAATRVGTLQGLRSPSWTSRGSA